jgi:hypothetical protein
LVAAFTYRRYRADRFRCLLSTNGTYSPTVWEPFFGAGSRIILNSRISHILSIPDAALGAFSYVLDAITGIIGGRARWRTMPWMVVIFGLAVCPLGSVSVMLVIFQPVLFDAWCTLCLSSALVSVLMIGPAADEVLASLQYLKREHVNGRSVWRAFWGLKRKAQSDRNVRGSNVRRWSP